MCAIIGIFCPKPEKTTQKILDSLLRQSQIRGKHATGISYVFGDNELMTISASLPSTELLPLGMEIPEGLPMSIIGHCRYSTSDLEYNQPIATSRDSIVHNGVITQKDPSLWKDEFGYECQTKNDSELILRAIESGEHPLIKFSDSSIAAIHLDSEGVMRFYRNAARPLWWCEYENSYIVASTKDILKRCFEDLLGTTESIEMYKCSPGVEYSVSKGILSQRRITPTGEDRQKDLGCSHYYNIIHND